MPEIHIGRLPIGRVPRVVGTITTHRALSSVLPIRTPVCDLFEVRLDLVGLGHADWLAGCEAIEAAGIPVIVTLRAAAEGGTWDGADADRLPVLERALARLSTVDVEAGSAICDETCKMAMGRRKPVIVSFHDFAKTPPLGELQERLQVMRRHANTIPKITTMIRDPGDVEVLKALLGAAGDRPLCVIGMGSKGADSRVTLPKLGSCLTYGYIDSASAPGQWPAAELFEKVHRRAGGE